MDGDSLAIGMMVGVFIMFTLFVFLLRNKSIIDNKKYNIIKLQKDLYKYKEVK